MNELATSLRGSLGWLSVASRVVAFAIAVFLLLPILAIIPASVTGTTFITFPPIGFSMRWYELVLTDPAWTGPITTSLIFSFFGSIIALLLGLLAAMAVWRSGSLAPWLSALFLAPTIVPWIVYALGLYFLYDHFGVLGSASGVIAGQALLSVPVVFAVSLDALRRVSPEIRQAAVSLGSGWLGVMFRVELPIIKGTIIGALLLAFASCFDEVVVALFVTRPDQLTLPAQIWLSARTSVSPAIAAVSVVILVSLIAIMLAVYASTRTSLNRSE